MNFEQTADDWCGILGLDPEKRDTLRDGIKRVFERGQQSVFEMSRVEREELAAIASLPPELR